MINLDEEFLASLGLESMPSNEKAAFLRFIYETLELRVGEALCEGLNNEQMGEFEAFIDRDMQEVSRWFDANAPDFATHDQFERLLGKVPPDASDEDVLCEYGAMLWLDLNRPNYSEIVSATFDALKQEILSYRDELLEATK